MRPIFKFLIGIGLTGALLSIIVVINRDHKTIGMSRAAIVFQKTVIRSATGMRKVNGPFPTPPCSMPAQIIQLPGKSNNEKSRTCLSTQNLSQPLQLKNASVQLLANSTTNSPVTVRDDVLAVSTEQSGEQPDQPLDEKAETAVAISKTAPQETVEPAIKATPKKITPVFAVRENSQFPGSGIQNTLIPQRVNETSLEMSPSVASETVLDRFKVACDFQSLGVGYKVFQLKKAAVDVLAYTDKAGVGVSFPLTDNFHLGIDNTYKYSNGEQQFRVYLSVPLGAPK